jgi:hypothetical protein
VKLVLDIDRGTGIQRPIIDTTLLGSCLLRNDKPEKANLILNFGKLQKILRKGPFSLSMGLI